MNYSANSTDLLHFLGKNESVNATTDNVNGGELHFQNEGVRLTVNVVGISIGILGVGLNLVLIAAALHKSSRASVSKMSKSLILSLSSADLLLLAFGLPYDIVAFNEFHWLEGRFGCKVSALVPELSRCAWIGSLLVFSLPHQWPTIQKIRESHAWIWLCIVWCVSLSLTIPFGVRVDCITPPYDEDDDDYRIRPEECFCVFTSAKSGIIAAFATSFTFIGAVTIGALVLLGLYQQPEEVVANKQDPRRMTLAALALAYMACTLPRYVYIMLTFSSAAAAASSIDSSHEAALAMSVTDLLSHGLFYASAFLQWLLSPFPRQLVSNFLKRGG